MKNAIELVSPNPDLKEFPHPFDVGEYGSGAEPYTLAEQSMMAALGAVKDKPEWYKKVGVADIAARWRKEMQEQGLHPTQIEWVLEELRHEAKTSSAELAASPVDGVYQSDSIVSEQLRQQLMQQVAPLEQVAHPDYHPGSHEQMIDLVHPSLYPYVAGLSREVLFEGEKWENFVGGGEVVDRALAGAAAQKKHAWMMQDNYEDTSAKFQWLPGEVSVAQDGKVSIDSYINNLHPQQHAALYKTLAVILERFIPLWNRVLTDLRNPRPRRHGQNMYEDELYGERPKRGDEDGEDFDEDQAWDDWQENRRPRLKPEVKPFHPPPVGQSVELRGRKLQVIFKLANIEIDPAKGRTEYDGGSWHVEGMRNEHIVASGIYYYHTENITESKLDFRVSVREPDYEQGDDQGVEAVYGLVNEGALVQRVGSITCEQGRSVAWPNTLQHQVQNFRLIDPHKKGIRKILVFFLVDPSVRILSTSIVPPQQRSWFEMEMKKSKPIPGMPGDIQGLIGGQDWFFPHEKALELRLELMKERKFFTDANTKEVFQRPFSLCEQLSEGVVVSIWVC